MAAEELFFQRIQNRHSVSLVGVSCLGVKPRGTRLDNL